MPSPFYASMLLWVHELPALRRLNDFRHSVCRKGICASLKKGNPVEMSSYSMLGGRYYEDPYSGIRSTLAPEYAELPPEQLGQALEGLLGPGAADYLEGFWS